MAILPNRPAELHDVHTPFEEVLHAATHGVGVLLAIAALIVLILRAVDVGLGAGGLTAISVYGACAIALYLASTVYHAMFNFPIQHKLASVDHAAIYLKIAGSYTPFALVLPELTAKLLLIVIWSFALLGIGAKVVFHYMKSLRKYDWISLASYIGMGWVALFIGKQLYEGLQFGGFAWLLAGGLCFTVGAGFYAWKSRAYTHTIFHCFVLAGSICHFVAIYAYVLKAPAAA
ncbi:hemolysin, putative [Parvularcula bermudensis HTCC2503]|uniref:Hemolysin, putative n=1 Tax=Parvularcula bermudensis (strain ATCC BAA-594 / HTCC2503 / KCTC 12087) TaxID=314260 RepID=E0TGC4_PARBH|nr:hemolysin III family protein [Parvularcula bermudensis]ADM09167.1 hemolysin, putative [Parvularcula bermudensis HTCC2503]